MSIKSVMPTSHLILCCPLLLLPPIPPSIRVFSNESTLLMRWPQYWTFSPQLIITKSFGIQSLFHCSHFQLNLRSIIPFALYLPSTKAFSIFIKCIVYPSKCQRKSLSYLLSQLISHHTLDIIKYFFKNISSGLHYTSFNIELLFK